MSDLERLLEAFSTGSLLRPSPEIPNIVDLSRTIASLTGVEGIKRSPGVRTIADKIGTPDHLVFILVDGLGINLVNKLAEDSFLRSNMSLELRTVFPSSTAVALSSIATGDWPNKHAVTGWWTHLPEIGGSATILPFVKRADNKSLSDIGVIPENVLPVPSLMKHMTRDTLLLFPERIAHSVYSVYFSGGKPRRGYASLREAVDTVVKRVNSSDRPTYTYLYTDRIDTEVHACGTSRPEVKGVLIDLDRIIEQLKSSLGDKARIVISADHGFLDTFQGQRHQIRAADPLMALLRFPPSGDARAFYLHARKCASDSIREYFYRRFPGRFAILTLDEAENIELFGPGAISTTTRSRMGDLIAISTGPDVIEYRPVGGEGRIALEASQHSGLAPSEMRVPLIVA